MKRILVTADIDDAVILKELSKPDSGSELLHMPLEKYCYGVESDTEAAFFENIDSFAFVILGGRRNTRYYLQWLEKNKERDVMNGKVHLAMNRAEMELLEESGVPVISPREHARPIDILEFLLRISLQGHVLYPCAKESAEEIPGLLREIDLPVTEFTVCSPVSLTKSELEQKRTSVREAPPDMILFHSRSSVTRTLTAFPDLDLKERTLVSASAGVTQKLIQNNLRADYQADGSWKSVLAILT